MVNKGLNEMQAKVLKSAFVQICTTHPTLCQEPNY